MQVGDNVSTIVDDDVRSVPQSVLNVSVVGFAVFAFDRVDLESVRDQRCRHVILGRKGITGTDDRVCSSRLQRVGKIRGLTGDMNACDDSDAGKRLVAFESLPDQLQHGHLAGGPGDSSLSVLRKANIANVESRLGGFAHGHLFSVTGESVLCELVPCAFAASSINRSNMARDEGLAACRAGIDGSGWHKKTATREREAVRLPTHSHLSATPSLPELAPNSHLSVAGLPRAVPSTTRDKREQYSFSAL